MADLNQSTLPTAAYITFAADAALPPGKPAAVLLEERLGSFSGLPAAQMRMDVGGAGLLLGFAHPTGTLAYVRALLLLARSSAWDLPPLCIGAHVAAVTRADAHAEATISGSSIDGAVRVAGLAGPNQALATAQFQTVMVHLLKIGSGMLTPLGKRTTASGKTLDVFEIGLGAEAAAAPAAAPPPAPVPAAAAAVAVEAQRLAQIEHVLAAEIGPIARLLVKQATGFLPDQNRFLIYLADAVPEPERRSAFLARATQIASA
jgi:hypothetical protein